jgi:hypothetical protein
MMRLAISSLNSNAAQDNKRKLEDAEPGDEIGLGIYQFTDLLA